MFLCHLGNGLDFMRVGKMCEKKKVKKKVTVSSSLAFLKQKRKCYIIYVVSIV